MALYEITLEQQYYGQQIINRWNYVSGSIPEGVSGAFKALVGMGACPDTDIDPFGEETVFGLLKTYQNTQTHWVQAIARNIYSVTDFFTYAFPPDTNGGDASGDPAPPVIAMGFTSDRTRSDIRRAQKRFVGLTENDIGAGGVWATGVAVLLQTIGDAMGDVNVVPAGVTTVIFTPHVFGREKYVVEESGKDAYRYYETEEEQLDHIALITAFDLKDQVRTQTTRQYGRGS